jgi:hypothetical protein
MPGPTIQLAVRKYVCETLILLLIATFALPSFARDPDPLRAASPFAADNQPTPPWTRQGEATLKLPSTASHFADHNDNCCCHQHNCRWWLMSRMHLWWLLHDCSVATAMIATIGANPPPPRRKGGRTVFHSRTMLGFKVLELVF